MSKVIVGMSGGVDSAVAAYLLQLAGYEVIGVTLKNWLAAEGESNRCCEIDDARMVCDRLGINYFVKNCFSEFENSVTKPFVESYMKGLTPNPCIECNKYVKWKKMLDAADDMQAEFIATGHYASVVQHDNGRFTVKKATHVKKDQTYMLYKLTQEQLSRTIMPLGRMSKDEVRNVAEKAGLPVANKPDSQEICFVSDDDYANYIEDHAETELPGEGDFVDEEGNLLGKHKGIIHYTIGQRKGLGIALGYPAFVKNIDVEKNQVVLSSNEALFEKTVICRDVNFLSIEDLQNRESIRCYAKIRYHHDPQIASVERIDGESIRISFDEPVRAVTPGQSAVFYDDDDCLIGGGVISGVS
ncbi:MAG: tRNA 2-thiouridine(34) synthase MnmA [Eubacterium sp.]|nr:tRNA 2-thiouridine(34) synthase MnmA [Eubacterium sp.]